MDERYDGLIFDLDGTLWDSSAVCAEAWNRALEQLKIKHRELTPEDLGKIMGMPHQQAFETVFPSYSEDVRESIADACYDQEISAIGENGAALYEGVTEGIKRLYPAYPLYVVSNCLTDYLQVFFSFSGLKKYFKDSECHGNTGLGKAENIRDLVKRNGLKHPIYIGDTGSDQDAALMAGITFCHVTYGFGRPGKPCRQFPSFDSLTEFFLSLKK